MTTPKCYSYIRFSTPEQSKGDSQRRQLKLSEDYAKEHGLKLEDSMEDLGRSAFKGVHRTKGALGGFLLLVKSGKIPKGSTLIVESLDRLSREQVSDAFDQFRDIIKAGIRIVTLADRMEYTSDSINTNFSQLIISLSIMSRANEESETKSRRIKASWEQKRKDIYSRKLTARAPEWLQLNDERTEFLPIPERAEIIKKIYKMKLAGAGPDLIARKLNIEALTESSGFFWMPEGKKGKGDKIPGWRKSYVTKILRNSAVIGEYQPHKFIKEEDGTQKRQPVGEVIKCYFPAVVPEELYYGVQAQFQKNELHGYGSGKTGKIRNLFSHLAKCGYCGSSMEFLSKGNSSRSSQYLACDSARRELGCKRYYIRYDQFENLVLSHCKGLNPTDILPANEEREAALHILRGRLTVANGKSKIASEEVINLTDSIANTESIAVRRTLEERLEKSLFEKETQEAEAKVIVKDIEQLYHAQDAADSRLETIRELLQLLQDRDGDELIDLRSKLRLELRSLIEFIKVYPVGRLHVTAESADGIITLLSEAYQDNDDEGKQLLKDVIYSKIDNKELREYHVHFKGGSIRILSPEAPQKIQFDFDSDTRCVTIGGVEISDLVKAKA